MAVKIVFIGAGSILFTRNLVADIMSVPELADVQIVFTDIDKNNLAHALEIVQRDLTANAKAAKLTATLDRREAIRGANYVISLVRIGGLEAFGTDIEIPLRYGIDQSVGDTLCAGGIMYGQRNVPWILTFCKDIAEVAALGCLFINYANPMAINTWAANRYGNGVKMLGLCHGVQSGHALIAEALGVDKNDIEYICAGINHQTWYTQVKYKGTSVIDKILPAFEKHPRIAREEKVRIDMLRRFGYFSTESNGHLSEYVPWYRKRPDELGQWIDTNWWINGETGGYLRYCTENRLWWEADFKKMFNRNKPYVYATRQRSNEHCSYIIEGLETSRCYRGHFNVVNNGTITNLPADAIVEVPGYIDRNGINIPRVGDLPLGCAAVCNASISVQRLAVEAAVHGDDMLLRQAMMMDPLVGAVCTPPEIWQLVDELLVAQAKWLPQYGKAIASAKKRIASSPQIKPKATKGTRIKQLSVAQLRKSKNTWRIAF